MPLVSASIAALTCLLLPIKTGDAALLITLAASASYIAVPAAMRLALPEARPSIYLTLSLGHYISIQCHTWHSDLHLSGATGDGLGRPAHAYEIQNRTHH